MRILGSRAQKEKVELRELDYDAGLTAEEADERFRNVQAVFEQVREDYSGIRRLRRKMAPEDNQRLAKCFSVLLPLSLQEVVQKGLIEEVTAENVIQLQWDIFEFQARFPNTGVKIIQSRRPLSPFEW